MLVRRQAQQAAATCDRNAHMLVVEKGALGMDLARLVEALHQVVKAHLHVDEDARVGVLGIRVEAIE